ncbi:MAG: bifunctional 2-C-methyl-D-erythritol 4-phosphate cytidylyltransferase/2-C-methyl-D-erythritol 2,4-cyclodiphosphate synthase [Rhodospirillales bacterium]|nr:bifunctional 2-C-methyl-D-erythritol 4-phosphate cytidylyltransferase/2-C-methyl-D-erythritol 2,4-cyclodiphosphate synthase [Rhodospirillales bacterium]
MKISATNIDPIPFYVLIAAGGSGTRLGGDRPKQYRSVAGKTILRHTIEAFLTCPGLRQIRVIIDPAHAKWYQESVTGLDMLPPINGGEERNDSVSNGLNKFSNLKDKDIILIHDAARPFVSRGEIEQTVIRVKETGAATLAAPVSDTLRHTNGHYIDRTGLWAVQTPQGFHYGLIRRAHEKADPAVKYTDDTAMVAALGHPVEIVTGSRRNFKITTAEDMNMAEQLITAPPATETRIGSGFDVHAFTAQTTTAIRIGGIDIPHDKGLAGHSDADVALHALTDALLGTIGAGDIGQHFPPSDPQWKGADSALFLEKAVHLVKEQGGAINNMDLTIICETPKIGPYREAIRARIAKICSIDESRINIKGTTTEKLGFTGRGEGIAAQAAATIQLPKES